MTGSVQVVGPVQTFVSNALPWSSVAFGLGSIAWSLWRSYRFYVSAKDYYRAARRYHQSAENLHREIKELQSRIFQIGQTPARAEDESL